MRPDSDYEKMYLVRKKICQQEENLPKHRANVAERPVSNYLVPAEVLTTNSTEAKKMNQQLARRFDEQYLREDTVRAKLEYSREVIRGLIQFIDEIDLLSEDDQRLRNAELLIDHALDESTKKRIEQLKKEFHKKWSS